jgi:CheY-like chemotaxis protein
MPTHKPPVLIIDDNHGLVELIERYLTGQPCRVVAAHSGPEGLRIAEEATPAAIILDIMMPQVDGWQVLEELRRRPRTARTPIIICSVFNNPALALSLGATRCLLKPVRRDDMLRALAEVGVI